jgi:hypothetical protein
MNPRQPGASCFGLLTPNRIGGLGLGVRRPVTYDL